MRNAPKSKLHTRPMVRCELPTGKTQYGYIVSKGWDGTVNVITVQGGRYTLPANCVGD